MTNKSIFAKLAEINYDYHSSQNPITHDMTPWSGGRGGPYRPAYIRRARADRFRNPGDAMMDGYVNRFNRRFGGPDKLAFREHIKWLRSGRPLPTFTDFMGDYPGSAKITKGPARTHKSVRSPNVVGRRERKFISELAKNGIQYTPVAPSAGVVNGGHTIQIPNLPEGFRSTDPSLLKKVGPNSRLMRLLKAFMKIKRH